MKRKADEAGLSMLDMKISGQERDLGRINEKYTALKTTFTEKSAALAALKIDESSDPSVVKRMEKSVKKLEADIKKMRAHRDKIAADVKASDQHAQHYRDAIALAPDGEAYSKETIDGLKAAAEAADARVQTAETQLAALEAQEKGGRDYSDVLVLTLVNLVSMLPADEAKKLLTALTLKP